MTVKQAEEMYKCLDSTEPEFSEFIESRYNGRWDCTYTMGGRNLWKDPYGKECKSLVLAYYKEHGLTDERAVAMEWNRYYAYADIMPTYKNLNWRA